MARDTNMKIQVKQQKDGWWYWVKLDGSNDVVSTDRGRWNLEKAIYAAHEANPELDRVTVILPDQDASKESER